MCVHICVEHFIGPGSFISIYMKTDEIPRVTLHFEALPAVRWDWHKTVF